MVLSQVEVSGLHKQVYLEPKDKNISSEYCNSQIARD